MKTAQKRQYQMKIVKQKKNAFIAFKASPSFKVRLDTVAQMEGKKTSAVIREAVEAKLAYTEALMKAKKLEPDI